MIISTSRLNLKVISKEDIENIHKLHSFPEVCEFNTTKIPEDLKETRNLVEPYILEQQKIPRKYYAFSISMKATDEFIGIAGITLSLDKFNTGEVYFELMPDYWNNGYATEVCMWLISFGLNDLNLHRVEANTDSDNINSMRVLEKSGMQKEGLRRKVLPIHGKWKDGFLYAIVETEND